MRPMVHMAYLSNNRNHKMYSFTELYTTKYAQCSLTDPVFKKKIIFPMYILYIFDPIFLHGMVFSHIDHYCSQEDLKEMGYKPSSNL